MNEGESELGPASGAGRVSRPRPPDGPDADAGASPISLPRIKLRAIFLIKAAAHALLAVELWLIRQLGGSDFVFVQAALAIAVQVAVSLTIALRNRPSPRPLLAFSLLIDILVVSAWVHSGGGTEVVAGPTIYVLVVGLAGVLLSANAAYAAAALSTLAYGLVIWAEHTGYLPHHADYARPPEVQARIVAFVGLGTALPALLVAYAVNQLRSAFAHAHREGVAALRELSQRLSKPLSEIHGHAAAILREIDRIPTDAATRIQALAQEASDVTRNILDRARIEAHATHPHLQELDVASLLAQARDPYTPAASLKGIRIEVSAAPQTQKMRGDRELLSRILANLTSNAVRFTPKGGVVTLAASRGAGETVLAVRDAGPPVDAAALPALSERPPSLLERRGEHMRGELDLVRRLVEAAGCRLVLDAPPAGGNVFAVVVPDTPVETREPEAPRREQGISALPESSLRAVHCSKAVLLSLGIGVAWLLHLLLDPTVAALSISLLLLPSAGLAAAVALWRGAVPFALIVASIAADITCVLGGTHVMGGVDVVAGPMFLAAIIGVSGFVLTERAALVTAAACVAGYAGLVGAEHLGLLPHHSPHLRPPDRQLVAVLLVGGSLTATGAVVSYALHQMRAAFRVAQEMRIEAVNALSHDLKNPLHVVLGYTALLEGATPEERKEFAGWILEAAERALSLVRGGLDFSAWGQGMPPAPRLAPVQVNDVVKQTVARFRLAAAERNLRVVARLAPDLPLIAADAELLERAIANLISNGIKYGGSGGMVEVSTDHGNGHVVVAVRDQGRGLKPAEQARLFRQFSRADSAQGIEGTGLGLYIVRTIAEAHGGCVRVESAVGRGSTFTLALPKG